MIQILLIMLIGVLIGKKSTLIQTHKKLLDSLTSISIYTLLFLLGLSTGSNQQLIQNLDTIGYQGLYLAISGFIGSIIFAKITFNLFFKKHSCQAQS